jgi:tRNA(Ile)-lysidine synthase
LTHDDPDSNPNWASRWSQLARKVGVLPSTPVALALSGGADSILLLHILARSVPRPKILAIHVDHGLRGDESDGDAAFCARACARLGVPFAQRRLELDGGGPNLEAVAREERYKALIGEASSQNIPVLITGHHEDDALETLLMRWMRGSHISGLSGPKPQRVLRIGHDHQLDPMKVVRPLRAMRSTEVRMLLRENDIAWREDSSNESADFTRNRVRNELLPSINDTCGGEGIENLRAFASAVENLEEELSARTAHLAWAPPAHAAASRSAADAVIGGSLKRTELQKLAPPLKRRALWRLLQEGTGCAPSRAQLAQLIDDLETGCTGRYTLQGGWIVILRREDVHLVPAEKSTATSRATAGNADAPALQHHGVRLDLPGSVELPDGRSIQAELIESAPDDSAPRGAVEVELDAADLPEHLTVRFAQPGDRFHGIGAPGSRPLTRFLADAGVPREERRRIPLVFAGSELIWVAGLRPCDSRKVQPSTGARLRIRLLGAALPA